MYAHKGGIDTTSCNPFCGEIVMTAAVTDNVSNSFKSVTKLKVCNLYVSTTCLLSIV